MHVCSGHVIALGMWTNLRSDWHTLHYTPPAFQTMQSHASIGSAGGHASHQAEPGKPWHGLPHQPRRLARQALATMQLASASLGHHAAQPAKGPGEQLPACKHSGVPAPLQHLICHFDQAGQPTIACKPSGDSRCNPGLHSFEAPLPGRAQDNRHL